MSGYYLYRIKRLSLSPTSTSVVHVIGLKLDI